MGVIQNIAKAISQVGALDFSGIGKAMSLNTANMNDVARNVARNEIVSLHKEQKALSDAMKNMKAGSKELNEATARYDKLVSQKKGLHEAYKVGTMDSVQGALKDVTGKDKMGYLRFAQGYFGDSTYGSTRIKTAVGATAAAAVGTRYLSGGNLTSNAQGERDIVGIPFI